MRGLGLFLSLLFFAAGCEGGAEEDRGPASAQGTSVAISRTQAQGRPPALAVKRLSDEEMIEAIRGRLSRSTQGLVRERRPDGLMTIRFGERFGHVTLAKRMADGTVRYGCLDNPGAVEAAVTGRSKAVKDR